MPPVVHVDVGVHYATLLEAHPVASVLRALETSDSIELGEPEAATSRLDAVSGSNY